MRRVEERKIRPRRDDPSRTKVEHVRGKRYALDTRSVAPPDATIVRLSATYLDQHASRVEQEQGPCGVITEHRDGTALLIEPNSAGPLLSEPTV